MNWKKLKEGPSLYEKLPEILEILLDYDILWAYNSSYDTGVSTTNFNDLAGYSTGFNLTGGTLNPAITAPVFNATSPKSLTFANGKYGVKEQAYSSGTGNTYFNTTSANGYTIIALVNASAGNILSNYHFNIS